MATFGVTSQPSSGFFFDDVGNSQFWSGFGNFPGGIITDINAYAAGDGASATCKFVIWDGSGNILYQSGNVTFGSGTQAIGGQAWQRLNGLNVFIPATTNMSMGFWTSGHVVWTYGPNGGVSFQRTASPASQSGAGTEGAGYMAVYIDYTPGNGHVVRAGSFTVGQASVMRSGSFTSGVLKVMRGGTWVQGS